jgi:hypothetical protein
MAFESLACQACAYIGYRVLCASIRPESIGMATEVRFPNGFYDHSESFLYNPIADGWDAQWAHFNPATGFDFTDVRSTHRLWFKPSSLEVFSEPFEVSP